jgi:hypothetical protein
MNDVTQSPLDEACEAARMQGRQVAADAATWATDGNTDPEHARRVLAMLEDGDPAAWDYLPRIPNLSGEYSDEPTPRDLADLFLEGAEGDDLTALADAWEEGVGEMFGDACEAELRNALGD